MTTENVPTMILFVILLYCVTIDDVTGHGGMIEPPMRSYAWKAGFEVPVNYDWNSLYCGGFNKFKLNGGKCGVCGDPYDGPFHNEKGGSFDTGVIVRHYPAGIREIEVKVEITAHHKGYFQFKICDNNEREVTQRCLDRNLLTIRETQSDRFHPPEGAPLTHELHVILPPSIVCDRCVLQWTYKAGNSAGTDESGRSCLGCGLQETFVNCADISIGGTVESIQVVPRGQSGPDVVINQLEDVNDIFNEVRPDVGSGVMSPGNNNMNNFRGPGNQNIELGAITTGFNPALNARRVRPRLPVPSHSGIDTSIQSGVHPSFTQSESPGFNHNNLNAVVNTHRSIFSRIPPSGSSFNSSPSLGNRVPARLPESNHVPRPSAVTGAEAHVQNHFNPVSHPGLNAPQLPPQHMLPPPSRVSMPHLTDINSIANQIPREHRHNSGMPISSSGHSTLLGSVGNLVNRINNPNTFSSHSQHSPHNHVTTGSIFPSNQELNVQPSMQHLHSSPLNSNSFPHSRQTFHPSVLAAVRHSRENWLSGQQSQLRRHKLLVSSQQAPYIGRTSMLPRRIVVHSASIAQHLLNKYPQLRGRVYLSQEARAKNFHSQIQHRYARLRNHI